MKQAVMTEPGENPIARCPGPERRVPAKSCCESSRIGVCGSDVHVYHGKHPYTKYPVVQGHEYSATRGSGGERRHGPGPGNEGDLDAPERFAASAARAAGAIITSATS